MDLNTAQRTFTYGISGIDPGQVETLPFLDSAGNIIKCSYVHVSFASEGATGHCGSLLCELSSASLTLGGDMVTNAVSGWHTVPGGADPPARGAVGFGMAIDGIGESSYTWHGAHGDIAEAIRVQFNFDDTLVSASSSYRSSIVLTYGNLYPFNSTQMAIGRYDKGV